MNNVNYLGNLQLLDGTQNKEKMIPTLMCGLQTIIRTALS